jgi:hypothetical protein
METKNPLPETLCVMLFLLACLSLNAQKNCATCWGQNDTPELTTQDKQALRLYSKLNWYDFSTYRLKGEGKRAVWIAYAVAGVLHGGREAYHAESTVFEKRFNAAPLSFFGSEQWKRQYFDRDPENMPHKPEIWNSARDYWHFSHTAGATLWVSGAFILGASKQPLKYRLLDGVIAGIITSAFASTTYELLR